MARTSDASLPYHEPGITTVLIQSSFLVILNVINAILDRAVYCGLLGQIFIGVAWGTPGAKWLTESTEEVIVQLGYLGLILLVYEGGLSTSFASLKANLPLSTTVAITGISVPIGLSFTLQALVGATPLQAFAAGAALCSTSLGTTFTVLATSGLTKSRLGVVLTSAAMMDDVVGLVMVQVISNLGGSASSFSATTVIRPVFVSLGFAVLIPLACRLIVRPTTIFLNKHRQANPTGLAQKLLSLHQTTFAIHTAILFGLVAGGSYAGTSNLFTAYLAGASISWWDAEMPHLPVERCESSDSREDGRQSSAVVTHEDASMESDRPAAPRSFSSVHLSGIAIYGRYYHQAVGKILKPLFFHFLASIGFSIPISQMFTGFVVWRSIVYTSLMLFAKLVCGLWLVRFSMLPYVPERFKFRKLRLPSIPHLWCTSSKKEGKSGRRKDQKKKHSHSGAIQPPRSEQQISQAQTSERSEDETTAHHGPRPVRDTDRNSSAPASQHTSPDPKKPISLYPASILGGAMVARGEIGFLISSIAQSKGIFSSDSASSSGSNGIFLIVTWAIVLCTIIGPLTVGLLVRRVKKLQKSGEDAVEGRRDVLGVWGVE